MTAFKILHTLTENIRENYIKQIKNIVPATMEVGTNTTVDSENDISLCIKCFTISLKIKLLSEIGLCNCTLQICCVHDNLTI